MCPGNLTLLELPPRYVCTFCARRFTPDEVTAIQKGRERMEKAAGSKR